MLYYYSYIICTHSIFSATITFLILANTVVLAMDKYPIEEDYFERLELINNFLSWCFFAEMVIKLIGLGFKAYAQDRFNLFDASIVVISTVENVLSWSGV